MEALVILVKKITKAFLLAISKMICTCFLGPIIQLAPSANPFLSQRLVRFITANLTLPANRLASVLMKILPACHVSFAYGLKQRVNLTVFLAGGISEELIFRGLIQGFLLDELPKILLKKIKPGYEGYIDAKIAKVARVVLNATLFALAHAATFGNGPGFLLFQFGGGLFYGAMAEIGTTLTDLTLTHFFFNMAVVSIRGGL